MAPGRRFVDSTPRGEAEVAEAEATVEAKQAELKEARRGVK